MIVTYVSGVDLGVSGAAPITDIGRSLAPDQPIVLIDAATGERWPIWSELDAQADPADEPALIVRVAKNLPEGHRFIVAMRNLRTAGGSPIPTERGFALYRDSIPTFTPAIESRRAHFDALFRDLEHAGLARADLDLAWDFTVASETNLAGRMLHIRDDAFASLNGGAPRFTVASVTDNVDDRIFRRVIGTFTVPSYLTGDGSAGNRFNYAPGSGPDAVPARNGNLEAQFICNIPRSVSVDGNDPATPARGAIYGHGLLGSQGEVNAGNVRTMANDHRMVYCATKWSGFADEDIGVAVETLKDVSNFPKVADRTQQGFLNQLFLARLVKDPNGFAATVGARILLPGLAPGRSPDLVPFWGITPISFLPWNGSAIVYWDSGNPHPPLTNLAPSEPAYGNDPHEFPRRTPAAQLQKSEFLRAGGVLVDTCGGQACLAPPA